jgi:hypothetical protein
MLVQVILDLASLLEIPNFSTPYSITIVTPSIQAGNTLPTKMKVHHHDLDIHALL